LLLSPALPVVAQTTQSTQAPSAQVPTESAIEQIKKAVVFLQGTYPTMQTREVNGVPQPVPGVGTLTGTGFIIWIPDPRLGSGGIRYLVTNRHLIREPGTGGGMGEGPYFSNVSIRVNRKEASPDGSQFALFTAPVVDNTGSLAWFVDSVSPRNYWTLN
jgi:hypothetical protein